MATTMPFKGRISANAMVRHRAMATASVVHTPSKSNLIADYACHEAVRLFWACLLYV